MKMIPLLLVALLAAVPEQVESPEEIVAPTVSIGFSTIYELESMTVVYPSLPEKERSRNRSSAMRRADLLEANYGIAVSVVSDDDIGAEELAGHLLVLGWNNRVVVSNGHPWPVKTLENGFDFLGITASEEEADLAFYHTSPWNSEKKLAFWSRIDPEADRARILPSSGSDWVVILGFQTLAQGNFEKGDTWPPVRNRGAEADHRAMIAKREAELTTHSSSHYNIRYNPKSFGEQDVMRFADAREEAFAKAVGFLGDPGDNFRIDLRVYEDLDDKAALSEVRGPVHSVARDRQMHMTQRYARSTSAHEEIHIIARALIGPSFSTAIYEGLSFSFERTIQRKDLDLHAAIMVEQANLPRLADLLHEERLRALPREIANPASGLMVSWLRSFADQETFAAVYTSEDFSLESMGRTLGVEPETLERSFVMYVSQLAGKAKLEMAYLKAMAAARDHHLAGDYAGLADSLMRALEAKPGDPETTFNLAAAQMRIGEYAEAERNLEKVLRSDLPPDHNLTVFGYFQMGRVLDLQGRREEALAMYRKVLDLPDLHNSHRSASELIETPFTKDRLD